VLKVKKKRIIFEKAFTNGGRGPIQTKPRAPMSKSILVLFLKKELISFLKI